MPKKSNKMMGLDDPKYQSKKRKLKDIKHEESIDMDSDD